MTDKILEVRGLTKTYGGVKKRGAKKADPTLDVLKGIDLDIYRGDVVCLIGPSGCGKTTTLRVIAGFITPKSGNVFFDGKDIASVPPYKRQVNTVFQKYALFPHLNVYENVAFAMHVLNVPRKEIRPRVEYILELVHLEDKAKCYPDTLSGGEQQRVAVARALVHNPKLVIADEPTGNIDPELSLEMMQLLERVSKMGITVLVVTHEHELVHRFHQRVVTLSHGRIVSDVPADPVAAAEDDLSLDVAAFDADDASAAKKEVAAV